MDNVFRSTSHVSSSQNHKPKGSWELPPLSFDPTRSSRSESSNGFTPAAQHSLHHRVSQGSIQGSERAPSLAEMAARLATPTPSADDDEQAVLKEAGVVLPDSPSSKAKRPATASSDGLKDQEQDSIKLAELSFNDNKPKVRRSLQRTLRDSHHSHHSVHHHRNRKGKDSVSSAGGTEASSIADSEGLARGTGSFTVHGKKASVITFGAEWQSMSPEERLKLRRSAHADDSKLAVPSAIDDERLSIRSASESDARPISAVSNSTATTRSIGFSTPTADEAEDVTRSMSNDVGPDEIRRVIPPSPLLKESKQGSESNAPSMQQQE